MSEKVFKHLEKSQTKEVVAFVKLIWKDDIIVNTKVNAKAVR